MNDAVDIFDNVQPFLRVSQIARNRLRAEFLQRLTRLRRPPKGHYLVIALSQHLYDGATDRTRPAKS